MCAEKYGKVGAPNYENGVDMNEAPFIGRETELKALKELLKKKTASLAIIQGRRRIGKSRLIQEFAKGEKFYSFMGLEPSKETDAQTQRDEFCRQLGEQCGLPGLHMKDWGDIFSLLAKQASKGRVILLLDEISWMAFDDPTFLGKLKNAWDTQFSKNSKLILILCGSVSSWIEKNIISSTAFLGRPSFYLNLEELPLEACNYFWGKYRDRISAYEKLKVLSVTGGVPRYLEFIMPTLSAEENIKQMCFLKTSPLFKEFERIFSDIFGPRSEIYRRIVQYLANGIATQSDIIQHCERSKTGDFSEYLNDLVLAGFVSRDHTWHLKNGEVSKLSHYRLKDNYIRFYLKYIYPNRLKIEKGDFDKQSLSTLPGWNTIMALQFENLVLNNQHKVIQLLSIPQEEVIFSNPYFQRKTKAHSGCQIDFLIQTRFNNIYVCEIKFSQTKIGPSIIQEVNQKIEKINLPKSFSYRPVLIHVNGVHKEVEESGFFSEIIDFGRLLSTDHL